MRLKMLFGQVLAALFLGAAGAGGATNVLDLKVEYTATSLIGSGDTARQGKLWRTPAALRHETLEGGRPQIVIARLDRNAAWLLLPEQKLAIEMGLENIGIPVEALNGGGDVKQTPVGQETIDGVRTTKTRIERNAAQGARFQGHVWTTAEGVVMKIVGAAENNGRRGAIHLSFRDVRVAKQDPGLFELPPGFRRIALVGVDLSSFMQGLEQLRSLGQGLGKPSTAPR